MRLTSCIALVMFLSGLFSCGRAGAEIGDDARRAVVTDTDAFCLLPEELISGPRLTLEAPSPDGRYILIRREVQRSTPAVLAALATDPTTPPPSEVDLLLWDSQTHVTTELWRLMPQDGRFDRFEWMPGSHTALVSISQEVTDDQGTPGSRSTGGLTRYAVLRATAEPAHAEIVAASPPRLASSLRWSICDTQPTAVLMIEWFEEKPRGGASSDGGVQHHLSFRGVGETGPVGPEAVLPSEMQASAEWAEDGTPLLSTTTTVGKAAPVKGVYRLDTASGRLAPTDAKPAGRHLPREPVGSVLPLVLFTTHATARDPLGETPVDLLWVRSANPRSHSRALVSTDGTDARLLPDGTGIVYSSKGALWVAPIARLSLQVYRSAQLAAQKVLAVQHAKMIGLAILCWAQDNDEKLPAGENVVDQLNAYLQDDSMFQGFTYQFPGATLAEIDSPATTVMGLVTGPGGSALLYADGHVKWQDQQP